MTKNDSLENHIYHFHPEIYQYGVIPSRRIILSDQGFELKSANDLVLRIAMIKEITGDDSSEIDFYISSYGGDVFAMTGMVDLIRSESMKINTIGLGAIMSAAVPILACGTGKRLLTKNSVVMVHSVSANFMGNANDLNNDLNQIKQSQSNLFDLLEKYSNKPSSFWKKKAATNYYMTSEQCLEFGLVDKIIDDRQADQK